MTNSFELTPADGRKSFYGKCRVEKTGDGEALISYTTEVARLNEETGKMKINGWYSVTTARHINAFLARHDFPAASKKQIEAWNWPSFAFLLTHSWSSDQFNAPNMREAAKMAARWLKKKKVDRDGNKLSFTGMFIKWQPQASCSNSDWAPIWDKTTDKILGLKA